MGEYFASPPPTASDCVIHCIEEDEEPVASIQETIKSFRLGMASYEASREGSAVRVTL